MRRRDFVTPLGSAAAAWSLVACAPSARPDQMVPSSPTTDFPADSPLRDAIFRLTQEQGRTHFVIHLLQGCGK